MLKLIIITAGVFAAALILTALTSPQGRKKLVASASALTRNPLIRSLLFQGIWRLIRLMLFRR